MGQLLGLSIDSVLNPKLLSPRTVYECYSQNIIGFILKGNIMLKHIKGHQYVPDDAMSSFRAVPFRSSGSSAVYALQPEI